LAGNLYESGCARKRTGGAVSGINADKPLNQQFVGILPLVYAVDKFCKIAAKVPVGRA
jgi:hypothetical protein